MAEKEICILCMKPIRVMCQLRTGYCCQRHQDEGERLTQLNREMSKREGANLANVRPRSEQT